MCTAPQHRLCLSGKHAVNWFVSLSFSLRARDELKARVPHLQLLPWNQMAWLLWRVSVVVIKISSWCKWNGVQLVHQRNARLFVHATLNQRHWLRSGSLGWWWDAIGRETFYLFDFSDHVLNKKPPQVVECLQLPRLQEENRECCWDSE